MRSSDPKNHMTGLTLFPTHQRGGLILTKWTAQEDGAAYPTPLYFHFERKEANTRLIVFQLAAIQFHQMKTTLQYIHMEGGTFSKRGGRRGGVE